jgi:hypothetical protein
MTTTSDTTHDTTTAPMVVPDVGDIVRHLRGHHTVIGWLRTTPDTEDETTQDAPRPLLFSTRANATHLRVRSIEAGETIVRLADTEPTKDHALFSRGTIRAAHAMAEHLDGRPTGHYEAITVPDIGDTFAHDGATQPLTVTAWLKRYTPPMPDADSADPLARLIAELPDLKPPLVFCLRNEAEYVSASGHGFLILPVGKVTPSGRVAWPQSHLDYAHRRAASLTGEFVWDY